MPFSSNECSVSTVLVESALFIRITERGDGLLLLPLVLVEDDNEMVAAAASFDCKSQISRSNFTT
jgi:hypothetical protein